MIFDVSSRVVADRTAIGRLQNTDTSLRDAGGRWKVARSMQCAHNGVSTSPMIDALAERRKKLLYRALYRGFREADLLIGAFARAHLGRFDAGELDEFEALLNHNDRALYDWATGKAEPPADVAGPVFDKLRAFRPAG